ncbi:MAG: hypothetical protein M3P47_02245 [Pseudomonadota bacterium]|nr:hypothetical protein [Pseudomonadota bacterium]
MQESHAGREIDNVQFNALVEVMEARKVPIAAQNRLLRKLAPMHRDIVAPYPGFFVGAASAASSCC